MNTNSKNIYLFITVHAWKLIKLNEYDVTGHIKWNWAFFFLGKGNWALLNKRKLASISSFDPWLLNSWMSICCFYLEGCERVFDNLVLQAFPFS